MQQTNVQKYTSHNGLDVFVLSASGPTRRRKEKEKNRNGTDLDCCLEENGNNRQLQGGLRIELVQPI